MANGIEIEGDDVVRHVWLARPERRNAMNRAMVEALEEAADDAVAAGVRVLVVRGRGGHFCSGGDVADMAAVAGRPDAGLAVAELNRSFGRVLSRFDRVPLATISVCEGAVMGGGFGLASACDVTLAVQGARFRLPETSIGISPAQIMPFLVQRLGSAWSRRLAVTGETLDAEASVRVGLCHEVVDPVVVDARVEAVITQVLECEPSAVAESKRLVHAALDDGASAQVLDEAAKRFSELARSPAAQQGMMARLSKQPPPWSRR